MDVAYPAWAAFCKIGYCYVNKIFVTDAYARNFRAFRAARVLGNHLVQLLYFSKEKSKVQ